MFVKNARYNAAVSPRTDMPQYWVARVEELLDGARAKLQWFMETDVGSGSYTPTNNMFIEAVSLLRAVANAQPKPGYDCRCEQLGHIFLTLHILQAPCCRHRARVGWSRR